MGVEDEITPYFGESLPPPGKPHSWQKPTFTLPEGLEGPWKQDGPRVLSANGYHLALCCTRTVAEFIVSMLARIKEQHAEIERLKDDFQRIQSVYDFAKQAAEIERLRSRNAELEELVKIIAARSIWRDHYPDGPDVVEVSARNDGVFFTPDQIRKARALSTEGDGTEDRK